MTPQMIETLYRLSLAYAPEPETIFQQIVEAVAAMYGNTMAMVNLIDGDCLRFRTVVNVHPAFANATRLKMGATLCQFSLRSMSPLLIQNAREHPEFRRHIVVRLKLRGYLGVPISDSGGGVVGKMISVQSIAVAAAATGMKAKEEGLLFRFTLKHSVFLAIVIGFLTLFYAYVEPGWVK